MTEISNRNGQGHKTDGLSEDSSAARDPLEALAAEFAERLRVGDRVSVEHYASQHPHLAEQIRDLFPTIVVMEEMNAKRRAESGQKSGMPERLGDYRILSEIARGGMGIVYEAEQVSLGRRVAVKVLPPHALRRTTDVLRFEREAQTAASLHHSNIVPVFGVGQENGQRYIVMQLIRGVGLDEILSEIKRVVVDGAAGFEASDPASRLSTAKRSAAGLLESDLKLSSTIADVNAETVETPLPATLSPPVAVAPLLTINRSMGAEYFRNVARVGLQVAEAIQYAHQHDTLHRDIKPGNLILDEAGRVWIADFGLAKALHDEEVTGSDDIVGTMAYVAPERFQGKTTKSSDIYSLGVTLYEMLALQKAFSGQDRIAVMRQVTHDGLSSTRKVNKSVPRDLDTIVLKAAARDPRDRYPSAAALASDLEAFLEDRPIKARALRPLEKSVRWCRRNRAMTALLVLLALSVGLLAFANRRVQQQRLKEEKISKLAIGALDEIYDRFASTPLPGSFGESAVEGVDELETPLEMSQMPISKDSASLLENLLEFYEELSTQTDDSELVTVKLIVAARRVGDISQRLGQHDDARTSYVDAIRRIENLSPQIRNSTAMRLELARINNGIGTTYRFGRRNARKRAESHRNAVAILDRDDAVDDEQLELATSLYLLHQAERNARWSKSSGSQHPHRELGDSHLERAQEILARLRNRSPDRPDYDLLLARCLLATQNPFEPTESQNERIQAISILEKLVRQYPENPDYQFELGQVYQWIERPSVWTKHKRNEKELAEAEERLRNALEITVDLESLHPNIPKYYMLKKELHEFLGKVLAEQGNFTEADGEYRRAIQLQRMMVNRSENPKLHRPWLNRLKLEYGKLLRDAGKLDRAQEYLTKMARQLEDERSMRAESRNAREYSKGRGHNTRRDLEATYIVLASVLNKLGDDGTAREYMLKVDELSR